MRASPPSPPPNAASLGLLIRAAAQILATAITNAVGQLIIGTSINVDGASLSDLSVHKKGGGVDGAIWGQTALSNAVIRTTP